MEQRNNLVLHGTETFSRGALDNVALESGAVVLDSSAGRYLPYGSYTTPEFAMPAFCNLNVSWNASAPHNTLVEVRCRHYGQVVQDVPLVLCEEAKLGCVLLEIGRASCRERV